jgi:hypothetical protein
VGVHGRRAELEPLGDLFHPQPLGEQLEDLPLAGERSSSFSTSEGLPPAKSPPRKVPPPVTALTARAMSSAGRRLEHVAGGAGPQRQRQQVGLGVGGEDDHLGPRPSLEHLLGRLDAVALGQLDVDDQTSGSSS